MKLKMLLLSLVLTLSIGSFLAISSPAMVLADAKADICNGIGAAGPDCGGGGSLNTLIKNIINLFSIFIGVVSIVMMIYAGWQLNVSKGDPPKTAAARGTITYALIGLIVAALAQFMVQFVINTTDSSMKTKEQKEKEQQEESSMINNINVEYIASNVL